MTDYTVAIVSVLGLILVLTGMTVFVLSRPSDLSPPPPPPPNPPPPPDPNPVPRGQRPTATWLVSRAGFCIP